MADNIPNYLVIGASKCGTSSLCELLGQHPDVFMTDPKEPNFFCYDHIYEKGWASYLELYKPAQGQTAIGEGTTQYTQRKVYPNAVSRIVKHLPDVKLIYIVRHPLERMESLWVQMASTRQKVPFDFNKALRSHEGKFVDSSNYLRELEVYRQHFPDDRILVVFFEDFKEDPDRVLSRCFEFLGVDPDVRTQNPTDPRNVSRGKRIEGPWAKRIRRMPGFDAWHKIVPQSLRVAVRDKLKHTVTDRPRWDDATRDWVIQEIAEDTRVFLETYGKPADFWSFESPVCHGHRSERGS